MSKDWTVLHFAIGLFTIGLFIGGMWFLGDYLRWNYWTESRTIELMCQNLDPKVFVDPSICEK